MKDKVLGFRRLLPIAAAVLVIFASAASPQTERRQADASIQVGTVTEKSAAVNLRSAGKEVAPGVFEVDPASIRGKRLTIPRGDQSVRKICIGVMKKGECVGILIEF